MQRLNRLRNSENFGSVEKEGVSETIRPEPPLPEFLSLSWSRPLCSNSALWSRRAIESHHCYCHCLADGFFFPAMFFKSSVCESLLECHGFAIYLIVVASAIVSMYPKFAKDLSSELQSRSVGLVQQLCWHQQEYATNQHNGMKNVQLTHGLKFAAHVVFKGALKDRKNRIETSSPCIALDEANNLFQLQI
ncbi:hypothetical protein SO802_027504 [Lithocarpus litseifolius]|uniref:Uncharacterized protein n=1 Tax=Lithocarpus litseifolius TaxID=425828 RepID=A0AAW2C5W0_9ROSI